MEYTQSFSCGNEDLDEFFQGDFAVYAETLFGKSYCFINAEKAEDVICAFTVSNASIFTNRLPNARKKKVGKDIPYQKRDLIYPAVLIGRLGIDVKYQHSHVGTELLDFIKAWFLEPNNKTGCRYLIVDAYNDKRPISFYKKNGFEYIFNSEEQEREYRHIYKDKTRFNILYYKQQEGVSNDDGVPSCPIAPSKLYPIRFYQADTISGLYPSFRYDRTILERKRIEGSIIHTQVTFFDVES